MEDDEKVGGTLIGGRTTWLEELDVEEDVVVSSFLGILKFGALEIRVRVDSLPGVSVP